MRFAEVVRGWTPLSLGRMFAAFAAGTTVETDLLARVSSNAMLKPVDHRTRQE